MLLSDGLLNFSLLSNYLEKYYAGYTVHYEIGVLL